MSATLNQPTTGMILGRGLVLFGMPILFVIIEIAAVRQLHGWPAGGLAAIIAWNLLLLTVRTVAYSRKVARLLSARGSA